MKSQQIIDEILEHLKFCQSNYTEFVGPKYSDEQLVIELCEKIGYGRVMQLASNGWMKKDPDGAFVSGSCAYFVNKWKKVSKS